MGQIWGGVGYFALLILVSLVGRAETFMDPMANCDPHGDCPFAHGLALALGSKPYDPAPKATPQLPDTYEMRRTSMGPNRLTTVVYLLKLPNRPGEYYECPTMFIQTNYVIDWLLERLGPALYRLMETLQPSWPLSWPCVHFAFQNVRGTGGSGGEFEAYVPAVEDATNALEWIQNSVWSNKMVMMFGVSSMGVSTYLSMKVEYGRLTKQCYLNAGIATPDLHKSFFPRGAYRFGQVNDLVKGFYGFEGYDEILVEQEAPATPFWDAQRVSKVEADRFTSHKIPMTHMVGWSDNFQSEQLDAVFERGIQYWDTLFIDYVGHCYGLNPNTNSIAQYRITAAAGFTQGLAVLLLGAYTVPSDAARAAFDSALWYYNIPRILLYVASDAPNVTDDAHYVARLDKWPEPNQFQMLDLFPDPSSGRTGPLAIRPPALRLATWDYNPRDPFPTYGGRGFSRTSFPNVTDPPTHPCGPTSLPEEVRRGREDFVLFTGARLTSEMITLGKATFNLNYASLAESKDTDFIVHLLDRNYDAGTSRIVGEGEVRMRWRNGKPEPELPLPKSGSVEISLGYSCWVWKVGHSVEVLVTSSSYPKIFPNPGTGAKLSIDRNEPVVRGRFALVSGAGTFLRLPVVDRSVISQRFEEFPPEGNGAPGHNLNTFRSEEF